MSSLPTTRDVYENLFFAHSGPESRELTADSRMRFHVGEYERVLARDVGSFRGKSLLETGCGPGSHSLILSRLLGPEGRLVSFDLSPGNIAKAERLLSAQQAPGNYTFRVSAAESFETDDPAFDFVFAHNWLHHSEDEVLSLFNILKPLKVGGVFYLCTYQSRTFRALVCELVRRHSLTFDRAAFLRLVPMCFPGGFARYSFFQIIHYENIIDDYLVPNVRFGHLDEMLPAFARCGLQAIDAGISQLLRQPTLFHLEDLPLKVAFTKTRHFDRVEDFRRELASVFSPSVFPFLPPEAAHLPALAERAYAAQSSIDGRMLLSLALHGLRCDFAASTNNASERFGAMERLLTAVATGDHAAYSLHAPDTWATKEHPLARQIVESTPYTRPTT